MMPQARQQIKYLLSDFITLNIGWLIFDVARFYTLPADLLPDSLASFLLYPQLLTGQIVVPAGMIMLYAVSGSYNRGGTLYRSRLDEFLNTILISLIGMLAVFFVVLINDNIPERITNYELMFLLFASLMVPTAIGRYIISSGAARRIHRGDYSVNTLIVGASPQFRRKIERIMDSSTLSGLRPVACAPFAEECREAELAGLPVYNTDDIVGLCRKLDIGAVVVLPPKDGVKSMGALLGDLYSLGIPLLVSAELFGPVALQPRVIGVINEPLVDVTNANIPPSVANLKRLGDIVVSVFALVLLSPVMLAIAIAVKLDSKGPCLYRQERVGFHGRPFRIIKFRSMHTNAEADGVPKLSSGGDDPRITAAGHFLRKYRLDELPQFWNVLVGEMSLVGPRPERKYYVDRIVERVPWYGLVRQVRPGITSWGMVKYGYASSVGEMVERSGYDLLYIRNISLPVDLKIIFHTVSTVFRGKGI